MKTSPFTPVGEDLQGGLTGTGTACVIGDLPERGEGATHRRHRIGAATLELHDVALHVLLILLPGELKGVKVSKGLGRADRGHELDDCAASSAAGEDLKDLGVDFVGEVGSKEVPGSGGELGPGKLEGNVLDAHPNAVRCRLTGGRGAGPGGSCRGR
eukprot:4722686-Alexandrium_andersonii.AAC.1